MNILGYIFSFLFFIFIIIPLILSIPDLFKAFFKGEDLYIGAGKMNRRNINLTKFLGRTPARIFYAIFIIIPISNFILAILLATIIEIIQFILSIFNLY